jgi:hypothetical protein
MGERAEVVRVVDEHSLIDSESYQRQYRCSAPRTPGHYIVRWAGGREAPGAYDDRADWAGPYKARAEAEGCLEDA